MTVKGGISDGKACLLRPLRGVISRFLCLLKAWASPEQCGQKYCISFLYRELNKFILSSAVSVSESQLFFRVPPSLLIMLLYILYIFDYQ